MNIVTIISVIEEESFLNEYKKKYSQYKFASVTENSNSKKRP